MKNALNGFIITATGTDAGKTCITAGLLQHFANLYPNGCIIKPVQTGCSSPQDTDAFFWKKIAQNTQYPPHIASLETFKLASSPHLAALEEQKNIQIATLFTKFKKECKCYDWTLTEGAGGLFVPLNEKELLIDFFALLNQPIILVINNKLGCINEALLSIEALKIRNLPLLGLIFNEPTPCANEDEKKIRTDNIHIIKKLTQVPILASTPYITDSYLSVPFMQKLTDALKDISFSKNYDFLYNNNNPLSCTNDTIPSDTLSSFSPKHLSSLNDNCHTDNYGIHSRKDKAQNASINYSCTEDSCTEDSCTEDFYLENHHTEDSFINALLSKRPSDEHIKNMQDFDKDHLWHPYTSMSAPLTSYTVLGTTGTHIYLEDGTPLIEGMSSWWCAVHGYNHPKLNKAIHEQVEIMSHVMFGGINHLAASELGKKLLEIVPSNLEHIFLSDSGSISVEVALKMALQYQVAMGKKEKNRFLTVKGGYHGDSFGAMSVCDPENGMHHLFQGFIPSQFFVERPSCGFYEPFNEGSTNDLEACFKENAHKISACIIEPVLQGAGGMWMYHPLYLKKLRELCTQYDVLLILDEIATGFGRTGKMFACEWAGIQPDILCIGKALTGGYMSLAATLCTKEIAYGISSGENVFMHGPTFMGNPLACSVALASIELLLESSWQENVLRIEQILKEELLPAKNLASVKDVRILGAVGVLEMKKILPQAVLQEFFVQHGVWIRPFGTLLYIMPPYIMPATELKKLCQTLCLAAETLY